MVCVSVSARAGGGSLWLALALWTLSSMGCGRIGLRLLPLEERRDGSIPDEAGELGDGDAGELGGGDAGELDASVPSEAGGPCTADTDGDGTPDCEDACSGVEGASYTSDDSCGIGYCQTHNTPSTCVDGVETACMPGSPTSSDDTTCDGVDDNCSGTVDEGYVPADTHCGQGVCASTGQAVCSNGAIEDTCVPGSPTSSVDDATWPGNGLDDDCDGDIDEDSVNPCDTTPKTYEAGAHTNVAVPTGCTRVTVQLWGGGGGTGRKTQSQASGVAGRGGAGGYASSTISIGGRLDLYVGEGAAGCGDAGGSSAIAGYHGGAGGLGDASGPRDGDPGGDGVVSGGGAGGTGSISKGGHGYYGGGGGGSGWRYLAPPNGGGGAGGAASVLLVGGTPSVVAGGGGGGGAVNGSAVGSITGNGGQGCGGQGGSVSAGGGGGGMCRGDVTQQGVNEIPYGSASIPNGRAKGGPAGTECAAGGDGYAILTFSP